MLSYIPMAADLTYAPDGITPVSELEDNAVARVLAHDFSKKDPKRFVFENFYAFGWNGKLSFEQRKKSAEFLAKELQELSDQLHQRHGYVPRLRIITFSHGGNVALNLAHYLPSNVEVELVLIACPVQPETEYLVEAECFKRIYTVASLNDMLQVSDPQNIYRNIKQDYSKPWLSKRFFNSDSPKVKQACVSVNGTYLGHMELFQLFNPHIPMVLNRLDALPEVKGNAIAYVDVQDKDFPFLNGANILDVLTGKRKEHEV